MATTYSQASERQGRAGARLALIEAAPLAWLVSLPSGITSLLPLLPVTNESGELCAFDGHLANNNPQLQAMKAGQNALVLFRGPEGYASPSCLSNRSQAPTWMFVAAKFVVTFELREGRDAIKSHLNELVAQMESRVAGDWCIAEMGERFDSLATRITAFRATITQSVDEFKLGQSEELSVLREMIDGLAGQGKTELVQWIHRENPQAAPRQSGGHVENHS